MSRHPSQDSSPRSRLLPHVYLLLLVLLAAASAWRWISGEDDLWAHAAVGRWIVQHRQVPHQALFLWTYSGPWVAHSWLTQFTLYGVLAAGGTPLVQAFTMVMAALPFVILWRLWGLEARITSLTAILFGLGIACGAPRFQPRPELFTSLFLTCLLFFLVRWSDRPAAPHLPRSRVMAAAPFLIALFVTWVNYHGMVLFGLALLGLTVGGDLLQERCSPRSRRVVLLAGLSGGAVLLNPFGIDYWKAFQPLGGATLATIYEWKPVWARPQAEVEILAAIGVLTLFGLLAWALNPNRRWSHLGWILLMAACFLKARRFIWFLALVDLAVLAANARVLEPEALWAELWRRHRGEQDARKDPPPIPPRRRALVRIGVAVWLLGFLLLRVANIQPPSRDFSLVPEGPARFIREKQIPGRCFNDYENSSYLDWSFGGQPPLFIDLLNAYPDKVLLDYHAIRAGTPESQELLNQYQIGYVVLTTFRTGAPLKPLADLLDRSPGWAHVYAGREGHIWVRRTPEYEYLWGPLEAPSGNVPFPLSGGSFPAAPSARTQH